MKKLTLGEFPEIDLDEVALFTKDKGGEKSPVINNVAEFIIKNNLGPGPVGEGINFEEMKARFDLISKFQDHVNSDFILLEDAEMKLISACFNQTRYGFVSRTVLKVGELIASAEDIKIEEIKSVSETLANEGTVS